MKGKITKQDITKCFMERGISLCSWKELEGLTRKAEIVDDRRKVSLFLRTRGETFANIGYRLNRDHATILHLMDGVEKKNWYIDVLLAAKSYEGFVHTADLKHTIATLGRLLPPRQEVRDINLHECTGHEGMEFGKALMNKRYYDLIKGEIERLTAQVDEIQLAGGSPIEVDNAKEVTKEMVNPF